MKAEWFKKWDDDGEYDKDYWSRTSDDDTKSSTSSGWWDKFHGNSKSSSSYTPVKSTSAYLRSTSSWSDWTSTSSNRTDDMLEVLKEVNKTINLTQNSDGGKDEKSLIVRYSNGHVNNDLTSNVLFISPTIMRDKNGDVLDKSDDEYYSGLDALNGQAMLCSFMRKSVHPRANSQYVSTNNWAIRNLYMTDLQTTAGNEIRSDWPGFQSYIEQQQKTFAVSKEQVIKDLCSPDQNIDNFINLLCYNRLSNDRIEYSDLFEADVANRMTEADNVLNAVLDTPVFNEDRFDRATRLFHEIQSIIDLNNPPPPPQDENGDDQNNDQNEDQDSDSNCNSGSSQGKSDDNSDGNSGNQQSDDDGDGNSDSDTEDDSDSGNSKPDKIKINSVDVDSNSPTNRRFTGDNSYNSTPVKGDVEAGEVDPNAELKERQKVERDNLKEIKDAQIDNACYRRVIPPVNAATKDSYKNFVRSHRTAINNVKNCFQFHNTDCSLSTYGLSSGSIDDASFHKVFMGERERLYERRDVLARKKWLVTVLIDQSGSMDRWLQLPNGSSSTMIEQARGLSIIFAEALKSLKEVDFSVYGFSTQSSSMIDTYCYQDKQTNKLEALIEAGYHAGTGIGFHVSHVGDKMLNQYPNHENRILFVVTDGEPNHTATVTMNGYEHTNHCCNLLRKRGINVFGIGIANAFGNDVGAKLFGAGNFTVINDVQSTLNVLTNSLRNFFKKMKK